MKSAENLNRRLLHACMEPIEARLLLTAVLDPSFGTDGIAVHDLFGADDQIEAMLLHEGKILVAGRTETPSGSDFMLARLHPDGTRDSSFGAGGVVRLDLGSTYEWANALAVAPDGKIVVAGQTMRSGNFDFAVARFHANGTLDETFRGGVVVEDFGGKLDRAIAVTVLGNGRIVVGGTAIIGSADQFALVGYDDAGNLNMKVTRGVSGHNVRMHDMLLLADGSIVAVGEAYKLSAYASDFVVMKFASDGLLDASFGKDGVALLDLGASLEIAYTVVQTGDGGFIVAGESNEDFAIARITATGAFDQTFGTDGYVITDIDTENDGTIDAVYRVLVDAAGNIFAVGAAEVNWSLDFAIAQYTAAGELIGTITLDLGSDNDQAKSALLLPDGRLLVGGYTYDRTYGSNIALAQFVFAPVDTPVQPEPSVAVDGPASGTAGESLTFVATIADFAVSQVRWDFGDGNEVEVEAGMRLMSADFSGGTWSMTHAYQTPGTYVVQVTVRDAGGAEVSYAHTVQIAAAPFLQPNLEDPEKTDLVVVGTAGNDVIHVRPQGKDQWVVVINGETVGVFSPTGEILVDGGGGDDEIIISKKPLTPPGKKK